MSLLTHLKLLTRLPDNHVLLKRQLTLNALQSLNNQGQSVSDWGQSERNQGQSRLNQGQSVSNLGQSFKDKGQSRLDKGFSFANQGQSDIFQTQSGFDRPRSEIFRPRSVFNRIQLLIFQTRLKVFQTWKMAIFIHLQAGSWCFPKRTPHKTSGFDFEQFGDFFGTFRLGNRTARGEPAAGREFADARNIAGNG